MGDVDPLWRVDCCGDRRLPWLRYEAQQALKARHPKPLRTPTRCMACPDLNNKDYVEGDIIDAGAVAGAVSA